MEGHWTEEPFKLSYREVAAISGAPLSLLSSYTDKKGVFHEGIMDRIERVTGYIHRFMGKEVGSAGKPKGNAQSYIKINYAKIWQDNCEYSKVKKNLPVSHTNRLDPQPVLHTNEPVSYVNTSVSIPNKPVSNTNEGVLHTNRLDHLEQPVEPVAALPKDKEDYLQITSDKTEDREENDTPTSSQHEVSPSHSNLNSMSPLGSSGHHIATPPLENSEMWEKSVTNSEKTRENSEFETQDSDASPGQGYKTDDRPKDSAVEKSITAETKPRGKAGQKTTSQQMTLIEDTLIEPDMTGPWTAEKVVQYAEWGNGKRYPDKQRAVQIEAARCLHREDASLTLEQFKLAYDECKDAWWRANVGDLHVKHMQSKIKASGIVRLYAMLRRAEQHKKVIQFKPKVVADDRSPEAVERAKNNNQKTLEKVQRLLAEKRAREEPQHAIAK
jgi:hypothetical protein